MSAKKDIAITIGLGSAAILAIFMIPWFAIAFVFNDYSWVHTAMHLSMKDGGFVARIGVLFWLLCCSWFSWTVLFD